MSRAGRPQIKDSLIYAVHLELVHEAATTLFAATLFAATLAAALSATTSLVTAFALPLAWKQQKQQQQKSEPDQAPTETR
jgi:hypothetical protein